MKIHRARMAALLAAAAVLVVTAGPAQAASDPVSAQAASEGDFSLAPTSEASTVGASALPPLSSGCAGTTDYPHISAGFISVHGKTTCPFNTDMMASTNVLRKRWYGWQQMANGYKEAPFSSYVNANAKWYCVGSGSYKYRGETYHRAYVNGNPQVGYTHADSPSSISC